jgi:hypothetical protein
MQHKTNSNISSPVHEVDEPCYSDLIKPEDLVRERPDLFSDAKMKWLVRQRHQNGLSDAAAIVKCGRTVLVVRSKFYEWLLANKA